MTGSFEPAMVLTNGTIVTVDRDFSVVQALAVYDGRIVATGQNHEIEGLAGSRTKRINLGGRCVLPGQVDAYSHFIYSGVDLLGERGKVNIISLQSIAQILDAIRARVAVTPPGQWIGTSCMYRGELKEGRFPNRWDLDSVSPDNPLYLMQGGRPIIANSRALELAGISSDSPNPTQPAGVIVRDEHGKPTGQLIAGAADMARQTWARQLGIAPEHWDFFGLDDEALVEAIVAQQRVFQACGVTATRDEGTTRREVKAHVEAARRGLLKTRTSLNIALPERYQSAEEVERYFDSYFEPWPLGDDILRVGAISFCFSLDGWPQISEERLQQLLNKSLEKGWTLAVTADVGGEDKMEVMLGALEQAAGAQAIAHRRFSLMHPMGLRRPDHLRRARDLGLTLNPNPLLNYYAAARTLRMAEAMAKSQFRLTTAKDPWEQANETWGMPLRRWFEAGFVVSAGSNTPAAIYDTERPFLGQYAAVSGKTLAGELMEGQSINREQILRMYTINGAYAIGLEGKIGSLEPGKFADLAVLDRNVLTCDDEELAELKVSQTYFQGELVFER